MKFSKLDLDRAATILGLIVGICTVFTNQEIGNKRIVGTIGGVAAVGLGIVTQRAADKKPTTEQVEDQETQ